MFPAALYLRNGNYGASIIFGTQLWDVSIRFVCLALHIVFCTYIATPQTQYCKNFIKLENLCLKLEIIEWQLWQHVVLIVRNGQFAIRAVILMCSWSSNFLFDCTTEKGKWFFIQGTNWWNAGRRYNECLFPLITLCILKVNALFLPPSIIAVLFHAL